MKIKRLANLRPIALTAIGVFLGRGAQADTVIDFETVPGGNNAPIDQFFGDYAAASSDGVTVTGFGTPNIGLTWTGIGDPATRWEYYNDSVWTAGQLNHSVVGTANQITFTPNSAAASVVVESFNFHPYYDFATFNERFTYDVTLLSGPAVLVGPIHITFQSDGTKAHPVNINYTGAPGQILKLRLSRVASVLGAGEVEGFGGDIAVDDIAFAQTPQVVQPSGPQVVSVTPLDDQTDIDPINYSYLASITNGNSTVVASSIKLKFDGTLVSPPATVTSAGDLTNVSYSATSLLAAGSTHTFTLTYADNLAANYTNEVVFTAANYPTLPPAYALPSDSGIIRGFTYRTVSASTEAVGLASSIARAKAQLNGTLINTNGSVPYTNSATLGTNADGSFNIDTVLNFSDTVFGVGNFPDDEQFPGLDAAGGPYDWFSTEALLYIDLTNGLHRLGVNSDDGFQFNALPPAGIPGSPIQLGIFDNGRSASDSLFDCFVQKSGLYCFQLIYFESGGSASCELFSVDLGTGDKSLVNDPADANAAKSFRVLKPRLTRIVPSGSNLVIDWAYGTPPFQVQSATSLTNPIWTDVGPTTPNRTATVPNSSGTAFIRVFGK